MIRAVPNLDDSTIHVWRGVLDQDRDVQQRLELSLSADERDRTNRFRFDRDRSRYVVGRGLLRALLGAYVGVDAAQLRFSYGPQRKPELVGDGAYFNLAHSGATALFAVSSSFEVGIDVELQSDFTGERIPERFFSPREVATLRALPEADQPEAFLTCWTRKEAILKARGDGLMMALDSFDVSLAPGEPAALLRANWPASESALWQLADLSDSDRGQIAALAAPAQGWHCLDRDIDISTLIDN